MILAFCWLHPVSLCIIDTLVSCLSIRPACAKMGCNSDVPGGGGGTMKLSKAQSKWVKQLIEDSASKEREELKRKEKPLRDLRQL